HVDLAGGSIHRRPTRPKWHEPHLPGCSGNADPIVGLGSDDSSHRGAVAGEVIGVVILIVPIFPGLNLLIRRKIDEIPAVNVVNEAVPIVIDPSNTRLL